MWRLLLGTLPVISGVRALDAELLTVPPSSIKCTTEESFTFLCTSTTLNSTENNELIWDEDEG